MSAYTQKELEAFGGSHRQCTAEPELCHGEDNPHCIMRACEDQGWPCSIVRWLETLNGLLERARLAAGFSANAAD